MAAQARVITSASLLDNTLIADAIKSLIDVAKDKDAIKNMEEFHLSLRKEAALSDEQMKRVQEARELIGKYDSLFANLEKEKQEILKLDEAHFEAVSNFEAIKARDGEALGAREKKLSSDISEHNIRVAEHNACVSKFNKDQAIFEAYKESCLKDISVEESKLKRWEQELLEDKARVMEKERQIKEKYALVQSAFGG